ncbi:MAG: glycosyltransferase family A protein [Lentisphaeria bacterium]|nr:glycosyltransferase family A protein [Lentisphaeria bacterium]
MPDLITLIIPAYNIAPFIQRCLRSVVEQTYPELEIIVVNDGSTDQTGDFIDQFARLDNRIVVIHKKNTGVSDTRNRGLDIAHGSHIGFVDGDDELYPDMVEFLLKNAKQYEADISHCAFEVVYPTRTVAVNGTAARVIQSRSQGIKALLQGRLFEPSACNKLYSSDMIKGVRYPAGIRINEDLLFNLEAFKNCRRSVFEDVVKYRYMFNPTSATRNGFELAKLDSVLTVAQRVRRSLDGEADLQRAVDTFYAEKLLNIYKSLHANHEEKSGFSAKIKRELRSCKGRAIGLRLMVLRTLLLDFPFAYQSVHSLHKKLYGNRRKWSIPESE